MRTLLRVKKLSFVSIIGDIVSLFAQAHNNNANAYRIIRGKEQRFLNDFPVVRSSLATLCRARGSKPKIAPTRVFGHLQGPKSPSEHVPPLYIHVVHPLSNSHMYRAAFQAKQLSRTKRMLIQSRICRPLFTISGHSFGFAIPCLSSKILDLGPAF